GHAHRPPGGAREFRAVGGGRGRQAGARHVREADPGLLEHRALAEDPGTSPPGEAAVGAVIRAGPGILGEARLAVGLFDRRADAVLQPAQVVPDAVEVLVAHGDAL